MSILSYEEESQMMNDLILLDKDEARNNMVFMILVGFCGGVILTLVCVAVFGSHFIK